VSSFSRGPSMTSPPRPAARKAFSARLGCSLGTLLLDRIAPPLAARTAYRRPAPLRQRLGEAHWERSKSRCRGTQARWARRRSSW
jgi:hypothetical protein